MELDQTSTMYVYACKIVNFGDMVCEGEIDALKLWTFSTSVLTEVTLLLVSESVDINMVLDKLALSKTPFYELNILC